MLAVAGCAPNMPLGERGAMVAPAYRYDTLSAHTDPARNSDDVLVILTFSGGGTRAAALAFGVMETLRATRIEVAGVVGERTLLDEVDLISSTSGGSFAAGYFALRREAMFARDPAGRTAFERDFLKRPMSGEMLARMAVALPQLYTGLASRTEIAAEHIDREVFGSAAYRDLIRRGRPFLILNAHDTTKRARFEFTQEQFDQICSDLASMPLSYAVMASSAVHGIFTPVRLRNYPAARCPPPPPWITAAMNGEGEPGHLLDAPRARRNRALLAQWYRNKLPDGLPLPKDAEFFVFLADGAGSDNLGLRAPALALASRDSVLGLRERIAAGRIKAILLIAVNAATGPDPYRDASPAGPSAARTMRDAADGLIRTVSEDSLGEIQFVFERLRSEARARGGVPVVYGPVLLDFDGVSDRAERGCFKRIATSFDLPEDQVDALRAIGGRLLAQSAEFQRFVRDHAGKQDTIAALPAAARFCPERSKAN